MTLASLGWGVWWVALVAHRLKPDFMPPLGLVGSVSCAFAIFGLGVAVLTLRAQRAWLYFALVPLLANAGLLLVPWLATEYWPER